MNQPASSSSLSHTTSEKNGCFFMANDLTYDEVQEKFGAYIHGIIQRLKTSTWFNHQMPAPHFLDETIDKHAVSEDGATSHFTPFIQKIIVKPGSKIITFGDIHGDYKALTSFINELVQTGYLDDSLKLIKDDVYLVFLGDYVNRGDNSINVMHTLCRLSLANPDHVILLRGNHEYAAVAQYLYKRFNENKQNIVSSFLYAKTTLLHELEERFGAAYRYPDLLAWFDYLPLAVYMGVSDANGSVQYVKFCHAGLERGYNPRDFLVSSSEYLLLQNLDRTQVLEEIQQHFQKDSSDVDAISSVVDLTQPQGPFHVRLGFQWDNFLTECNNGIKSAFSPERKRFYLGEEITKNLIKQRSSSQHAIMSIVRGHQHADDHIAEIGLKSPMLSLIRQQCGVVKQWNGLVYTLGASDAITGYHSFVMLTLVSDTKKWSIRHYFKKPEQDQFTVRVTPMLSHS